MKGFIAGNKIQAMAWLSIINFGRVDFSVQSNGLLDEIKLLVKGGATCNVAKCEVCRFAFVKRCLEERHKALFRRNWHLSSLGHLV